MIHLKGVHKYFGDNHVLRGVDLEIKKGEVCIICGPSGSGKSTMLRVINGLEEVQKGEVLIDGKNIRDKNYLREVRTEIGMVFQHIHLFPHLTVEDNLILAPMKVKNVSREAAKKKAIDLLERFGLPEKLKSYPNHLSGGQQQRVAICRAMAMNPLAILFDEPTSALDAEMIKEVLDAMRELAKEGMTMGIVTHEMAFAREVSDRIVFIDEGEICEDQDTQNFFNNPCSDRAKKFLDAILSH
jgi:polar amino acid transport system ATP-binding protein